MISGGRRIGSVCHCFSVYPRMNASVQRPADQRDRLLLEVARLGHLARVPRDPGPCFPGRHDPAVVEADCPKVDRHRINASLGDCPGALLVWRPFGETREIIKHLVTVRVKDVGSVFVDFDAALRIQVAVGVAADMVSLIDNYDAKPLRGSALGNRHTVKTGADDDEVGICETYNAHSRPGWGSRKMQPLILWSITFAPYLPVIVVISRRATVRSVLPPTGRVWATAQASMMAILFSG